MKPKFMWNHNRIYRRRKLIQMIQVICCSSLLSVPGRAGAFSRDFTTILAPECRAFSGALKIEKLKAPLIPGPDGAVDTNDWCITKFYLKHHWGGGLIALGFGPGRIGTLVSMATISSHRVIMGKML